MPAKKPKLVPNYSWAVCPVCVTEFLRPDAPVREIYGRKHNSPICDECLPMVGEWRGVVPKPATKKWKAGGGG